MPVTRRLKFGLTATPPSRPLQTVWSRKAGPTSNTTLADEFQRPGIVVRARAINRIWSRCIELTTRVAHKCLQPCERIRQERRAVRRLRRDQRAQPRAQRPEWIGEKIPGEHRPIWLQSREI